MTTYATIARFYDPEEAHVAAGYLRSHGFDVQVADQHALTAMPEMRIGLQGYRLITAQKNAFQCEALLRDIRETHSAFGQCEICRSTRLRRIRDGRVPILHLLIGFFFPFAPGTRSLRCAECGHKQPANDDEQDEP
ncbi:hypothetical protein [Parvularcula sp. LCG005]|uniref:hypothetical protein n=1 Tax=Parvularcula sp. LCG005 TaxID=3078805 RepID=UPI00294392D8|nr:hypothetical protein [Parvularcula sp. LCG005]WOI52372.1 hypothetical protein RUI03_09430 [Parvularcula sp. LCG005]